MRRTAPSMRTRALRQRSLRAVGCCLAAPSTSSQSSGSPRRPAAWYCRMEYSDRLVEDAVLRSCHKPVSVSRLFRFVDARVRSRLFCRATSEFRTRAGHYDRQREEGGRGGASCLPRPFFARKPAPATSHLLQHQVPQPARARGAVSVRRGQGGARQGSCELRADPGEVQHTPPRV